MKQKQRIEWVDYLKGISILLVIIGHTIKNYHIRTLIYSFHMPLFFLLSGYTSSIPMIGKDRQAIIRQIVTSFRRLIIPAYLIWIIRLYAYHLTKGSIFTAKQYILSAIYASGSKTIIDGTEVPAFGMMWFLVVLFLSRLVCDITWQKICSNKMRHIIMCGMCIVGITIPVYLPLSFDVVLVTTLFYHIGRTLKSREYCLHLKPVIVCSGILWGGGLLIMFLEHKRLELATREYPLFALSLCMAISACYFICAVATHYGILPLKKQISFIGNNSMTLFVIHAFDTVWYPYIQTLGNKFIVLFLRLGIDLCLFYVTMIVQTKINQRKSNEFVNSH